MADYTNGANFEDIDLHSEGNSGQYLFEGNIPDPLTELNPFFPDDTSIGLDQTYSTGIVFYYPSQAGATDTVTFESQSLPLDNEITMNQTIHKSAGGELSVYGESYSDRILNIRLRNVSETKKQRLYKFIANIVKFGLYKFEYLDETGTLYVVRYIAGSLKFVMDAWLNWTVDLQLYVISKTDPS